MVDDASRGLLRLRTRGFNRRTRRIGGSLPVAVAGNVGTDGCDDAKVTGSRLRTADGPLRIDRQHREAFPVAVEVDGHGTEPVALVAGRLARDGADDNAVAEIILDGRSIL